MVTKTSKNPANNLIDNPSSKLLVYAKIISVIAEKIRLIDRIDFIEDVYVKTLAPISEPIDRPKYTNVPSIPNPKSEI